MDKYDEVAIKILETIKNDGKKILDKDNANNENNEELQKVVNILENNFNVVDEERGRGLMKDTRIFDPETGEEFDAPLFTLPMFIPHGLKAIKNDAFPNYGIDNEYIGYTEKGIFYKINDFTRFMRRARKNPIPIIALFVLIYIIVAILAVSIKRI